MLTDSTQQSLCLWNKSNYTYNNAPKQAVTYPNPSTASNNSHSYVRTRSPNKHPPRYCAYSHQTGLLHLDIETEYSTHIAPGHTKPVHSPQSIPELCLLPFLTQTSIQLIHITARCKSDYNKIITIKHSQQQPIQQTFNIIRLPTKIAFSLSLSLTGDLIRHNLLCPSLQNLLCVKTMSLYGFTLQTHTVSHCPGLVPSLPHSGDVRLSTLPGHPSPSTAHEAHAVTPSS